MKLDSLKLKALGLAAALAATCAGTAGVAVAQPAVAPDERGDLALAPYYTVRDDWVTGLHIVNTSDKTQVVKMRFRRATDGMNALDFNLVLSPKDVYAGFLSDDANGNISWTSPDTTCTVPATQSGRFTMPAIYRAGAETGYVEIIAMGAATSETLPIALAARHGATTATPLDCQAVRSNFFADGAGTADGATSRKGVEDNATTWQAVSSVAAIKAGGRNTYEDSGDALKVSYFIRDNATGIEFGDNAVHIAGFIEGASITNQQYSVAAGDLNGLDFPDLNGGVPRADVAATAADERQRGGFSRLRAPHVLGAARILNEWSANPANGVEMDWVLTMPGQYVMLNVPQYVATLAADRAAVSTLDSAGRPMANAQCPRVSTPDPATGTAPADCDFRDLPVEMSVRAYNREAFMGQAPSGTLVPGPQPPTVSVKTYLPKVANVVSFGGNSVLGQTDANMSRELGQPFGWLSASLDAQAHRSVCDWDGRQDAGSGTGAPIAVGAASGAALKGSMVCSPAGGNVPVIGFAAWSRKVAANPNASYGRIVEHSYERARAMPLTPPAGLSLSAGDAQVTASWQRVSGASTYTLYYAESSFAGDIAPAAQPGVRRVTLTGTSHRVTGLSNGTRYYFVVTASNAAGQSPASAEASATPQVPVPAAPSGLGLSAGDAQVTASWQRVSGASTYNLYYATSSLAGVTDLDTRTGVTRVPDLTGTSYTAEGLTNGATYYFVVRAVNAGGRSAASNEASATPQVPAPAAPSGLSLTTGNAQVTASWSPVTGASRYTLYYATESFARFPDPTTLSGFVQVTVTGTSHPVTGLTNGTPYYFVVTAVNAGGRSAASNEASATPQAPVTAPAAPASPSLTVGNAQVTVSWSAVTGASTYNLYYSQSSLASADLDTPETGITTVPGLTGISHTVEGLTNGTTYYFVVRARNTAGLSAASAQTSAAPQAPPATPSGLSLTAGNAQVTASWSSVSGASSYLLYYSQSSLSGNLDTRTDVSRVTLTGTTHPVTGLSNGTLYYFAVRAVNAGGRSAPSAEASATPQAPPVAISGRLTFDLVPVTNRGLDYGNITQEPIRGVLVDAVDASGNVLASTRSGNNGRYTLSVAANTPVRIRASAHMRQTDASGPRWDVKVSDNTNSNALYTLQGSLTSSGAAASTRNLHAASGWVASASGGRYANTRAAGPFAILSFTYDALQKFAAVDSDMNMEALEYRWSVRNRMASGNLADGAIGGAFYNLRDRLIYLRGMADENTDEYDQSVVIHEFAHHFTNVMSRDDSTGGSHTFNARLDMRLAFSEGFANVLGAMIADDPIYRDTADTGQAAAFGYSNEENPTNPSNDSNRIGWYHSLSVAAIVYDIYDGTSAADNDSLNLGLAPIYNTLTSDGFRNNRHYTSIYTFANQLPNHVPASNRAAARSNLNALLTRQNIAGRGGDGAGETNGGGLPATARVLPVYKSITAGGEPITLCSVDDRGTYNRLGNRAFVKVTFTENGSHTLTLTGSGSGSRITLPYFTLRPYGNAAATSCSISWVITDTSQSCAFTGNFRTSEAAVLDAFDFQNVRPSVTFPKGDSCFTLSVVKNP